jgi:hypothetical protein
MYVIFVSHIVVLYGPIDRSSTIVLHDRLKDHKAFRTRHRTARPLLRESSEYTAKDIATQP